MLLNQGSSRRLRDASIAVILATVFSQFGLLVFLFTVPLYALYYRKGFSDLLAASGTVLVLLLVMAVWKTRLVSDTDLRRALIIMDMIIPVLLMLGLFFVIDVIPVLSGYRRLIRMLVATAVAMLVLVPVYLLLKENQVLIDVVTAQINAMSGVFTAEGSGTYETEVMKSYLGEEGLIGYMKNFYRKSAGAIYFLILMISSRVADLAMLRFGRRDILRLVDFKVPEILLWPMMLSAVAALVEVFDLLKLGMMSPIIWNAGLILLFLYGLQGLAILRSLFIRFHVPNGLRLMTEFILIMILVMPGINMIVIIGLPVLGVSETWINLRKSIRST
ncbi:MAG: hypothetical protein JEZ04_16700 [Spirochaetales bacterium]|nr:hypothetical protein [Spirochaetales bacterium]